MWLVLYCTLSTDCPTPTEFQLEAFLALMSPDERAKLAVIDDFKLSSAYSPVISRGEPTVTVGKRITGNHER